MVKSRGLIWSPDDESNKPHQCQLPTVEMPRKFGYFDGCFRLRMGPPKLMSPIIESEHSF